ncbi:hypothetical protein GOV14_03650 [Candidatus Pacearchaeota archaeon]|nr:hypothetical protein [Candidatus Pacearchaeota archaeon]
MKKLNLIILISVIILAVAALILLIYYISANKEKVKEENEKKKIIYNLSTSPDTEVADVTNVTENTQLPEEKLMACTKIGCETGSIYVGSINSDKYYACDCHYANRINPENIICFRSDEEALAQNRIKSEC